MRIILMGYIVRFPLGGMSWHYLHYLIGLKRLGHEVFFMEDSGDIGVCYDPSTNETGVDCSYGLNYVRALMTQVDIGDAWAYFDAHTETWLGAGADQALEWCRTADVVINISGANVLRDWHLAVPKRVFIDTDPVFTQVRNLRYKTSRFRAQTHNAFFTFGENIDMPKHRIPEDGFGWKPTRQPIVLETWPYRRGPESGSYTTVMQWDSYRVEDWNGHSYGMKSKSFEHYMDFPSRTNASLEMAVGSRKAPRRELRKLGWSVLNPIDVTLDAWTYQRYITDSKGEFSLAKHGYVAGWTGWFSERSACYLASGRPVILQDTGFSNVFPTGEGLLAFNNPDEAVACIAEVDAQYQTHCDAAHEIAHTYFSADKVLSKLLADL